MSRIPFKRHLVILVTCLLALGVIVPLATFAKGTPPGEQKRHDHPKVTHTAQDTSVTITTDCSSVPLQLLTTLQVGDTLTGNATLTSSDPNEESEGETLVIQEQNSSFTRTLLTLDVATGSATIPTLTATVANDSINACINGIDSDETGTVSFTVMSASRAKLFILLQGINSSLTQQQLTNHALPGFDYTATSNHPEGIAPYLKSNLTGNNFANANYMMYSYTGEDTSGNLQPYGCADTFVNSINNDVSTLNSEITSYAQGHPNTDIYLIGHSLGGVIAFGELAYLDSLGWPAFPNGNQLKGVITLDSPLGGIRDGNYFDAAVLFYENTPIVGCGEPSNQALFDLVSIHKTDKTFLPQGGSASIEQAIFGSNFVSNQQVAQNAANNGISVLTVGNHIDFTFDPQNCPGKLDYEFLSTQYARDEGPGSHVYGREIEAGNAVCFNSGFNILNHLEVLTNSTVEQGIVDFLINDDPAPLVKPSQLIA